MLAYIEHILNVCTYVEYVCLEYILNICVCSFISNTFVYLFVFNIITYLIYWCVHFFVTDQRQCGHNGFPSVKVSLVRLLSDGAQVFWLAVGQETFLCVQCEGGHECVRRVREDTPSCLQGERGRVFLCSASEGTCLVAARPTHPRESVF